MKILIGTSKHGFDQNLMTALRRKEYEISTEIGVSNVIFSLRQCNARSRPDLTLIYFTREDLNDFFSRIGPNDVFAEVWIISQAIDSLSLIVGRYIGARRVVSLSHLREKLKNENIILED